MDPERAHDLAIAALRSNAVRPPLPAADDRLAVTAAGLRFANPLGMAAGFDKNGEVPDAILRLGFGFVEVGTLTPQPQPGNPRPRLFRLEEDAALINRLGFNNEGHAAALARLRHRKRTDGIVGVNIGANRESADRIGDYVAGIAAFGPVADYLAVNISSPNTPGLRGLQERDSLRQLLSRVMERRAALPGAGMTVPVFLKIAPDRSEAGLDDIAAEVLAAGLDGVIVSNTTLSRSRDLASPLASEAGGLSGRPLFARSTQVLAMMRQRLGPTMPLIGVGGVASAADVVAKIEAGADLVQLYTAMIYQGPGLPRRILRDLRARMDAGAAAGLRRLRDARVDEFAAQPPDAPGE